MLERIIVCRPADRLITAPGLTRFKTLATRLDGAAAGSLIVAATPAHECLFIAIGPLF
jgi:hypothetical protein